MSDRGSFVTEFIYCKKCLKALEDYFEPENHKYCCAVRVPGHPVIAGRLGSLCPGIHWAFWSDRGYEISDILCHDVTFGIFDDVGDLWKVSIGPDGAEYPVGPLRGRG